MSIDAHTMAMLGAGIAALGCIGGGIGTGNAASKAAEAVGRQPEASGKIMSTMIIGAALSEATAIYAFLIAILLLFASK
ncbi:MULTISPECIES: ATP synthase F0 subunit C [Clostridium]|jgi:F-type H+-transporting ATPase subunit c|uniref:ATP synthase F0 subunit C n=1 Tax=Clostridium TaxID=1485 RepID=UPI00069EC11B|nr:MULTISPECIES: ATP synthase F0 subunit C [Clostridium]KOF57221.1 ATP F0F1 synthase subunit C [Clostridium sp. DMHC 10]MCD2346996.1 ATP synthase F0 subunit C [Clostridium guangxiense]